MTACALILMLMLAAPATAQEPSPSPEMQRLARTLVGGWRTQEKYEPGPTSPRGGVGAGTATVELGPGGRFLISEYTARDPAGQFISHSLMWWDDKAQAYRGVECYNRSPSGCEVGVWHWEGADLVSHGEGFQEAFTEMTPTSHTFYMDEVGVGGVRHRIMTITFTRSKGPGH